MSDTSGSGTRPGAAHGSTIDGWDNNHATQLDLSYLPSEVRPSWLNDSPSGFALPFDESEFEYVVVGLEVLRSVKLPELFVELRRVIRPHGELRLVMPNTGEDGSTLGTEDLPSIDSILVEVTQVFRISSVETLDGQTTVRASSDDNNGEGLAAVSAALAGQLKRVWAAEAERERAALELRLAKDALARAQEDLQRKSERIDEQRILFDSHTRRVEALSASVAALRAMHKRTEAARDEAVKRANTSGSQVERLRAELAEAQRQAQHEQWRANIAQKRKLIRIGDQVKRLRRPWLLPAVLYRVTRVALGPSVRPAASNRPHSQTNKRANNAAAHLHPFPFPPTVPRRPGLRVATILDEFSELAFGYEFQIVPVPREGWKEAFDRDPVDLLLVESAWYANKGGWRYAFTGDEVPKQPVIELVEYCRGRGIPTVFWNKEDPLEYDLFVQSARHFDWVFTVDENCVARYRRELGHDRVGVLPFGVQPRIHNPEGYFASRTLDVAFAGTYYSGKYPERQEQIESLLTPCADLDLHIYSRWESNPRYRFPDHLRKCVVGSLDYARTLSAYRRYKVFLNVNSVIDSKTMFSRRVLELLACGTPIVSGPSPGMEAMLGTGVVEESTDPETTKWKVRALLRNRELRDRKAVRGIRSVMNGNTYTDRVDHLLRTVGLPAERARKYVSVVAPTNRGGAVGKILENVGRQNYGDIELIIALHGVGEDADRIRELATEHGVDKVEVLSAPREWSLGWLLNEACSMASGDYVAKMDDDDVYGPSYLSDQLLAFDYTDADIVGKWSRFVFLESLPCLGVIFPGYEHRYTELVGGGTILARREVLETVKFPDLSVGEDTQFLRECGALGFRIYSTDRFNFVYVRHSDASRHTFAADDSYHLSNTDVVSFGAALDHAFV